MPKHVLYLLNISTPIGWRERRSLVGEALQARRQEEGRGSRGGP
ncbi:MAG: hypothetical protein ACRDS0_13660 [Pseudonocardiaceae bacterium]